MQQRQQQRRKHKRVDVNIPIVCTIENKEDKIIISSMGNVHNLSLGGMKISLPLSLATFKTRIIDYYLKLPKPFENIKGNAKIVWAYWDDTYQRTTLGMEISDMDHKQRSEVESILGELGDQKYVEE